MFWDLECFHCLLMIKYQKNKMWLSQFYYFLTDEAGWIKTEYNYHPRITINSKRFHKSWLANNKEREEDFQVEVLCFHLILRFKRCRVVIDKQVYGIVNRQSPLFPLAGIISSQSPHQRTCVIQPQSQMTHD